MKKAYFIFITIAFISSGFIHINKTTWIKNVNTSDYSLTFSLNSYKDSISQDAFKEKFIGEWVLKNRSIFDSVLILQHKELVNPNTYNRIKFTFTDKKLKYDVYNRRKTCGNGRFFINSCNWNVLDENINLFFTGGHSMHSRFTYECIYKLINYSKNEMSLKIIEILKKEESDFH